MDAFDSYLATKQAGDDDNNGLMLGAAGLGVGAVGAHMYSQHKAQQVHLPPPSKFDTLMGKARNVTGLAHEVAGVARDVAPLAIAGGAAVGAAFPAVAKAVQPHMDKAKAKWEAGKAAWNKKTQPAAPAAAPQDPNARPHEAHQPRQGLYDRPAPPTASGHAGRDAHAWEQYHKGNDKFNSTSAGFKRLWNAGANVGNIEIGPKKLTTGFKLPKFKFASETPQLLVDIAVKEGCDLTNPEHIAFLQNELGELKQAGLNQYLEADLFEKSAAAETLPGFLYSCEVVGQALEMLAKRASEDPNYPKAEGAALAAAPSEFERQLTDPTPAHLDPMMSDPYYHSARRMDQAFRGTIGAGIGAGVGLAAGLAMHHHLPAGMARDAAPILPTMGGIAGFYAGHRST